MTKLVTLTIEGKEVSVPDGTLIVDAARRIGVDVPVFCYHPKMEPVGMCRMCLVQIGRPVRDRNTGELVLDDDGSPKIDMNPRVETACTTMVAEGMVVLGSNDLVRRNRKDVVEFLLTSHPLDCPICDKGGECPLQDLTMDHGPGTSRFIYDNKIHLAKHYPLGDLIVLDRERCIQCGRCVRFQDEIVDDPVLAFEQRGRALQIITNSDPGFDSYFSGNTTDICPVGALTTVDFRFGARPWELKYAASICPHCPVGCNLTVNVRREAKTGGQIVIKRVMPRQNEFVNELWICDKGRFAYHFVESGKRITQPLVRQEGELRTATWEQAIGVVAAGFQKAGEKFLGLGSGRLANEDLFNLVELSANLGGKGLLYTEMAGGDLVAQVGVAKGTNFSDLGPGTAILVVACDLEEEAPIWWLRVKQAVQRGATLIVANPRWTKSDRYARYALRYPYGAEAAFVLSLVNALSAKRPDLPDALKRQAFKPEVQAAAQAFAEAENGLVLFGSEGTSLSSSGVLAQACANLLITTNHVGRPNNGLIGVWTQANTQGAWDMGLRPPSDLRESFESAEALYFVAADPASDVPDIRRVFRDPANPKFLVVQELFLTETAKLADVVLPAQAITEREGSYTSGERRVQRFYPAIRVRGAARPDYAIIAEIGKRLGFEMEGRSARRVMSRIAEGVSDYREVSYSKLAEVIDQWPIVGHDQEDRYYGGTAYENTQGLGVQLTSAAERGESVPLAWLQPPAPSEIPTGGFLAVPVTRLYDNGRTVRQSEVLHSRLSGPTAVFNAQDAERLNLQPGRLVRVSLNGTTAEVVAQLDVSLPEGIVLIPRSTGVPLAGPTPVGIEVS